MNPSHRPPFCRSHATVVLAASAGALVTLAIAMMIWMRSGSTDMHVARDPTPDTRQVEVPVPSRPIADDVLATLVRDAIEAVRLAPNDARPWIALAMIYDANELRALAASCYQRLTTLLPDHPQPWFQLAIVSADLGELDAALSAMERAEELDPTYPAVHWRRGFWLLELARHDEAEEAFQRATELAPLECAGWLGLARVRIDQGRLTESAHLLEHVILHDMCNVGYAARLLGMVYRRLGRMDEAAALLARRTEAEPVWSDPWRDEVNRFSTSLSRLIDHGRSLVAAGRVAEGIQIFEQLRARAPHDATILINLGNAYLAGQEYDRSIETLEAVVSARPNDFRARYYLAKALVQRAARNAGAGPMDATRARMHISRALELNPTYGDARGLLGDLLIMQGESEQALQAFLQAWRTDQEVQWMVRAGSVNLHLERWSQAAECFTLATRRDPTSAGAFHGLGIAQMRLGRLDESLASLNEAHRLNPDEPRLAASIRELDELQRREQR